MSDMSRWQRPRAVFEGKYNAESITVTLSLTLALYNAIELMLLILTTFKRRRGLYFWSLCISNYGVVTYSLGLIIEYFQLATLWVGKIFDTSGWMFMVTGQSLVLYSRLNLILDDGRILKAVKWMIIFNAFVWYTTITILDYGSTYTTNQDYAEGFFYLEHVQMTMFCLQEFIISGLYVWRTVAFLKLISTNSLNSTSTPLTNKPRSRSRSVIWQLLIINIIIIAMDVVLLFLQYKHWRIYQQSTKAFIYAVKLKLELNILSKLVDLVQGSGKQQQSRVLDEIDSNAIPGQAQSDMLSELSSRLTVPDKNGSPPARHIENGSASKAARQSVVSASSMGPHGIAEPVRAASLTPSARGGGGYSARATGREEDILYADMLKSIK
jgi:hypothetical protein